MKVNLLAGLLNGDTKRALSQDVSHGNAVVSEVIEAYDLDLAFSKSTIKNLINLLKLEIWKADNVFAEIC